MKTLLHLALHDLRLHVADRANIFFMLLMPLGFVFFFSMVNSGSGVASDPKISLPVVDRDGEFLATAFIERLRTDHFDVQVYDAAGADTTTFGTRFAEIPAGFSDSVLAGVPTAIRMTKRAGSDASFDMASDVRLHLAQVRFLGDLLRWTTTRDSTLAAPQRTSDVDMAERGRFLALAAEPAQVTVESRHAGAGRPVPRGARQSVPGVVVMFVVMTVLIGGSEALTREKTDGTLRRLATTPLSARAILLGKALGLTFLGLVQGAVLIVATEVMGRMGVLGTDFLWSPFLASILPLFVAYCFCVAMLSLLVSGVLRTPQQAESLAWIMGLALSALGGAWWPSEIMPDTMRRMAQVFPTSWAMEGLHGVITFGGGIEAVVTPVVVLLLMTFVFWWMGARLLRFAD